MKKTILAAMLLILTSSAFAQLHSDYSDGKNHIGFQFGYADAILRERTGSKDSLNSKTNLHGYKVGMVYETTFVKGFGLQLGLDYTFGTKLGKKKTSDVSTSYTKKDDYYYHQVELAMDWQYKFEVAKQTYLLLYTGPTFEAGLGYYKKTRETKVDPTTKQLYNDISRTNYYKQYCPMASGADPDQDGIADHLNRFNITWGVGAGFQYKRYFLRGGYDFGLLNPYHDRIYNSFYTDGSDYHYRGRLDQWSIKLGIYLWHF